MWKSRKDDERPPTSVKPPTASSFFGSPIASPKENISMEPVKSFDRNDVAHIGKSVLIKGELSGSEDLFLDGEVEGKIELRGHALTVGPNGRVKANVNARDLILNGKIEGNVQCSGRVELKKSAVLTGDIVTQRIIIEDGALFKGSIDIQKETAVKPEPKPEPKREAAVASQTTTGHTPTTLVGK
jgi:cytoskeletal protein CcmA (bactofilin family)